jgi:hypothetical protein
MKDIATLVRLFDVKELPLLNVFAWLFVIFFELNLPEPKKQVQRLRFQP